MKNASVLALVLALGAFTALPVLIAEEIAAPVVAENAPVVAENAPVVAEATPSTDMIEGTVKTVDLENDTLTLVLADGSEAAVGILEAETLVTSAGAESDLLDLVDGQKVSVRKTEVDGKAVAKSIDILA